MPARDLIAYLFRAFIGATHSRPASIRLKTLFPNHLPPNLPRIALTVPVRILADTYQYTTPT